MYLSHNTVSFGMLKTIIKVLVSCEQINELCLPVQNVRIILDHWAWWPAPKNFALQ